MPMSEARKRANEKYKKENYQYISFTARKGSRDRLVEAASATSQSVNGFIRNALNQAVMNAIEKPLEPVNDEIEDN